MKCSVQFLQTVGLVCSARNEMLGDSPDGICALNDECGDTICAAVEIKTMTAAATVHEAKEIRDKTCRALRGMRWDPPRQSARVRGRV